MSFRFIIKDHRTVESCQCTGFHCTVYSAFFYLCIILRVFALPDSQIISTKHIYVCFTPHVKGRVWYLSFCSAKINNNKTPSLAINPSQAPRHVDSFCWWMMARLTQEGSWKWFLSIISVPVSWLVAGVVSRCSCLSRRPSQNPGMVSKCVDTRARCHLDTRIAENRRWYSSEAFR